MLDRRELRTWAEIDLDALAHNYRALRAMLPQGCRFAGLVKADAYGHGAVPVAKKLEQLGADMLAVACVDEGEQLRRAGISLPILCLGQTPEALGEELLQWDVTQEVEDLETAQAFSEIAQRQGKKLKVHIKVDTGMSRLGFLWSQGAEEDIRRVYGLPGLECEGVFTHFANADGDETYTMEQFTRFLDLLGHLERAGVTFPIRHCAASAAVLNYPCTHLDMVRPGIALYGHYPAPDMEYTCPLEPVMTLKTRVAAVRGLAGGTPVSYGCTYVLKRDSRLAVLPVGYADGFFRLFSNKLEVEIRGRRVPLVGRVCMDMCMVDTTDLPEVQPGDEVVIYGDDVPVENGAGLVGTIQYELLCDVSPRVPRIYWES